MFVKRRWIALAAAALLVGVAIGWNDSRSTWDDTGVTAGLLVMAAALFGAVDPGRWWLWAFLVGVGTPLLEIGGASGSASLAAFVFSGVGAAGGAAARRLLRSDRRASHRGFERTELASPDGGSSAEDPPE